MNRRWRLVALAGIAALYGCTDGSEPVDPPPAPASRQARTAPPVSRWYTQEQVIRGYGLFQQHCATCHKPDASGAPNWKTADAQGKLPPPPLNGTGHAWHHPLALLRQIVRNGGIPMGGSMPPFKVKLDGRQIDDILAWVQSHWPDRIYTAWNEINQRKNH